MLPHMDVVRLANVARQESARTHLSGDVAAAVAMICSELGTAWKNAIERVGASRLPETRAQFWATQWMPPHFRATLPPEDLNTSAGTTARRGRQHS